MLKKVATYFHFLLRSSNQHGIHSPFVYDFVTKALYPKYKGNGYAIFKNNKKALFQNHTLITVQDFGAGSKVFKTNHRKISSIARVAGISNKRGLLLLKTLHYFKPKSVLEIGTSLGIATTALSITNKDISVTTLEGCTNTAAVAKDRFAKMDLENIDLKVGHFNDSLKNVTKNTSYDLIFFDGNHTKEATLTYFKECLVTIQNDSVWIFDDIYWSKEMTECWKEIQQHPLVTVTIDTYKWGFVFFRKEQAKEHFIVRV